MSDRTVTLLALLFSLLPALAVHSADRTVSVGGDSGWHGTNVTGLVHADEPDTTGALRIMPFRNEPDPETELLLSFDAEPLQDRAGRFTVSAPGAELSYSTRRSGRASLLVDSPADRVNLIPAGSRYFESGVEWASFLLEFWLYPVTVSDGERILEWTGTEGPDLDFRQQHVAVGIVDRQIVFTFENFFVPDDRSPLTISLSGTDGLIPRTWSHHRVQFDADTGLLEYLADGLTAAVTYVSRSGREGDSVYFPRTAEFPPEQIAIVPRFTGAIDELRLVRRTESQPAFSWYDPGGGAVESAVIDLGSPGARVLSIAAVDRTPGLADIFYYVKVSNTRSGPGRLPGEWEPVSPETFVPRVGRFFQIRAELLPDPGRADSPELRRIDVTYRPDPPPHPPAGVVAVPGDGEITLSWSPVLQEDIRGYLVYYGTQPGRYFGIGSEFGPSPIDVGPATSILLTGLENGTLYYFAVGAYDAAGHGSSTELSAEAAARPARVYR